MEGACQDACLHGQDDLRWPRAQPDEDGLLGPVGPTTVDCEVVTEHRAASLPEATYHTVGAAEVELVDELVTLPVGEDVVPGQGPQTVLRREQRQGIERRAVRAEE